MSDTPHLHNLTVQLPTGGDVPGALRFFQDYLGFTTRYHEGDPVTFAIVQRGAVELILTNFDDVHVAENISLRIQVDDVEAYYQEVSQHDFPAVGAKLNAPESKPWGTREFSLLDPAGVCYAFYQRL